MNNFKAELENLKNRYCLIKLNVSEYKIIFLNLEKIDNIQKEIKTDFFNHLYWLYWKNITIEICALVENNKHFKTLTIYKLAKKLANESILNDNLNTIEIYIIPFKKARNKIFAHNDYNSLIQKKDFERLELENLDKILKATENIFHLAEDKLKIPRSNFEICSKKGAEKIISFLELGIKQKKENFNNTLKKLKK